MRHVYTILLGIADKWKFGPVWDFGNAYDRHLEQWMTASEQKSNPLPSR